MFLREYLINFYNDVSYSKEICNGKRHITGIVLYEQIIFAFVYPEKDMFLYLNKYLELLKTNSGHLQDFKSFKQITDHPVLLMNSRLFIKVRGTRDV